MKDKKVKEKEKASKGENIIGKWTTKEEKKRKNKAKK